MQCERYSAGLTSRPASSSTTFAPASHNCFVMTPPAAPEPITHTSYFAAAIPGIILEHYCPATTRTQLFGCLKRVDLLGSGCLKCLRRQRRRQRPARTLVR